MSRIGRKTIEIADGVTVTVTDSVVNVKGEKGQLSYELRPEIDAVVKDSIVEVKPKIQTRETPAYWGLTRALIANMIEGVQNGYEKRLNMVGVGYRAKKDSDSKITLTVGFSHPVEFTAPEGVTLDVEGNDVIIVKGADKQLVGLTAAKIRKIRKPEPYKGKGIKYEGEVIKRKAGKAGTVGTA